MKLCKKCTKPVPATICVGGKRKNLARRVYCFDCSPFGQHNTKKLHITPNHSDLPNAKICLGCNQLVDLSNFYSKYAKNSNQLNSRCKRCVLDSQKVIWHDKKKRGIAYLGGKCIDCSSIYPPPIYQFHHLNPKEKDYDWGKLRLKSWDSIEKELDKCVLLCANCHILRHSKYT